ncbi:MAG: Maf family protein [Bacteroidota bacterium]|nr:Maf family protein [Bacteroidota bacterium]
MSFNDLFSYTIVLNSRSPRRKQLLEQMGFMVRTVKTQTSETYPADLTMEAIPVFLAKKKGQAYKEELLEKEILLCSDTMVFLHNKVLGKPKDKQEAKTMLQSLSNNKHSVISGCYIRKGEKERLFYEKTEVYFKPLSTSTIDYYIDKYTPLDKAGAYGIQEWIGMVGVEKIEGSFYNVMGLPTIALFDNLLELISL